MFYFREDVCVLSAIGTAAVINLQQTDTIPSSSDGQDFDKEPLSDLNTSAKCTESSDIRKSLELDVDIETRAPHSDASENSTRTVPPQGMTNCSMCHIPYTQSSIPFRVNMMKCAICR